MEFHTLTSNLDKNWRAGEHPEKSLIDTIKVGIPLTQAQLSKIHTRLAADDRWQWVQYQQATGELRFTRLKGLMELDQRSFHREIYWDVPATYSSDWTFLTFELSLPKFWYGQNIHLLYNYINVLQQFRKQLNYQLHCRLAAVEEWELFRVDPCFAWRCPTQAISQQILDSLRQLHYPRKELHAQRTSIMFTGKTYSFKIYLKLPEFIKHDRKALLQDNASLEWVNYLENLATGVIRCEATLRRKYLKRQGITKVADLLNHKLLINLIGNWENNHDENLVTTAVNSAKQFFSNSPASHNSIFFPVTDVFNVPVNIESDTELFGKINNNSPELGEVIFQQNEQRSVRVTRINNLTAALQYFLNKFLGQNRGMDTAHQVKAKLLEKYKSVKAGRLTAFWAYVQKLGTQDAKETFGHNSYYVAKRELKAAGVNLIEPVSATSIDDHFVRRFRLEIPSPYVTNSVDDFRDSGNVLNMPNLKADSKAANDEPEETLPNVAQ